MAIVKVAPALVHYQLTRQTRMGLPRSFPGPTFVREAPMTSPRHIVVTAVGDVTCVSLVKHRLSEEELTQLADEVTGLIDGGCRKMVFNLGPGALECLYSVFLSKLVMFQRVMREQGGALKLCDVTPEVREVFQACALDGLFDFAPDQPTAVAAFANAGA
jgi:anti-sigma B factor antagonist